MVNTCESFFKIRMDITFGDYNIKKFSLITLIDEFPKSHEYLIELP